MLKDAITARDVVDLLNELLKADHDAILGLMNHRERVTDALANHPAVQVREHRGEPSTCSIGLIGLLNGLFGTIEGGYYDGYGPIMVGLRKKDMIARFMLTEELCPTGLHLQ